ncbi:MAG: DUF4113 domain-containing protein, partial [Leptospiraceae bacterium]|nr:DUF4113 domain-containing protein [Leptospiraceae bacterium]
IACRVPIGRERARRQIAVARAFAHGVADFEAVRASVVRYTEAAARKLRSDGSAAGLVSVFVRTDPFRLDHTAYMNAAHTILPVATPDVRRLVEAALDALRRVYRPGYIYRKSGVVLDRLCPAECVPGDLFVRDDLERERRLSTLIGTLEKRHGRGCLRLASGGVHQADWQLRRDLLSPRYTTRWNELAVARA